jgi:hypothetical protein
MKLEPIIELPSMTTGTWRHFGVHVFQGTLTIDDMVRIDHAGNLWHRKNPGRVVEMVLVLPSEARLSGEERARMVSIIKRWESVRIASATVVLASGLLGSMHRSVLTGLQMIAPPPHPTKVFGVVAEAVTWITPHVQAVCGADATPEALMSAIEAQLATFRDTRPPA